MKQFYVTVILVFCLQFCFGQIGFEDHVIISSDFSVNSPEYVYSADIDGDGDMDILSADGLKIGWFKNEDGQGAFSFQNVISTDVGRATSIYSKDLDGDGDLDVLSSSYTDNKIAWYENLDGEGNFGPQQIITTDATYTQTVFSEDIDGDGDYDVISANADGVAWYENTDGQGNFSELQSISINPTLVESVFAIDIDNDGDIDVVSASTDGISWHENIDGAGTFGAIQIISTAVSVGKSVYVADIDGDGDNDVLSASRYDNKIAWYENTDGQGGFGMQQIVSIEASWAESVYAVDIDNDNDLDIVSASSNDKKIAWYENTDGQGSFGSQQIISTNADGASSIFVADINNNGFVDVIFAATEDDKVGWFNHVDGQGDFDEEQVIGSNAASASSVLATDMDGDGDNDVIFTAYDRIAFYRNIDGQGTMGTQILISTNVSGANSVFATDLDNDGDIDIVTASSIDDQIAWFENTNGLETSWQRHVITYINYTQSADLAQSVFAIDLDGDDDKDILIAAAGDDKIAWYENTDGQGNFGSQQVISIDSDFATKVFAADLDGDGDNDVLSASAYDDKIAWFENTNGFGNFGLEQIISTNSDFALDVYAVDLDGDGDMDVISASRNDNKVAWYENTNGLGAFGGEQIITTSADFVQSIYTADMDNDGDLDVLSASSNDDKLAWYENTDGQGTFSEYQNISINEPGFPNDVFAADMDNDGDMDVLSVSGFYDKIVWHENLGQLGNEINGIVQFDVSNDGCDSSDLPVENILVVTDNGANSFGTFTNEDGSYIIPTNIGNFQTSILSELSSNFNISLNAQNTDFDAVGNIDTVDFCIESSASINSLFVSVYPSLNNPRPGFNTTYQIVYNNIGTTQLSGSVFFEFDDSKLNFLNASETIASQTANTLTFDFIDLNPFETRTIDLEFNVFAPPTTNIGDELVSTSTISPVAGDETEEDNVFTLEQTVIGSYDPNDITVLEGEEITIEEIDKYLHYLIRFQNTGTASAINVRVENVLDEKLDWTTMQLESLSHTGRVEITDQTDVSFIFDNINLADSTNDEPNSHGYIAYKIKPKSNVEVGDIISGTADIFFDFNPPITTNTVSTQIVEPLSVGDYAKQTIQLFPNPTNSKLVITSNQIIDRLTVIDINGRTLNDIELSNLEYSLDVSSLSKGVYFLEIQSGNTKTVKRFIKS